MMDFSGLIPAAPPEGDSYRFATITEVDPVKLRLDGDAEALTTTPTVLGNVAIDDRVWVQFHGRQLIILGVVNATQM